MAISGTKAAVKLTSVSVSTSTGLAATLSTNGLDLQVDNPDRRHWDRKSATHPVVLSSTDDITGDVDRFNYVQGIVTFSTPHSTSATYTMDVHFLTASSFANAASWSLNIDAGLIDTNVFGSTWRKSIPGLRTATGSVTGFTPIHGASTSPTVYDYINTDAEFIIELYPSATAGSKYEGYAVFIADQVQAEVESVISEDVDFHVDDTLYYTP